MEQAFTQIAARAAELRLTETELREKAAIPVTRYWRAKTGKVGQDAQIRVIRDLEQTLDRLEAEKSA